MTRQRLEEAGEEKIGYPFASVLRLRVVQVVCGISTLLMGAVALIEEKTPYNLSLGLPAGLSTVLAAANNIYSSRGFDGYHPSTRKFTSTSWIKFRVFGPTLRHAVINILLWALATAFQLVLTLKTVNAIFIDGLGSVTINAIAGIELLLSTCVAISIVIVIWIDCNYDPDWQEPPDLAYSNTGTAVSMVTLSQTAAV